MQRHPRFRADLTASRHQESGGRESFILKDEVAQKFYRLSEFELTFLRSLNGRVSVEQALAQLKADGRHYTLQEAQAILARAAQSGLVLGTRFGTAEFQQSMKQRLREAERTRRWSNLYFLFIPILNPDRFLERTLPLFRLVANKWTAALAALATPVAAYLLVSGLPRLDTEYLFFFNLKNLLLLWITIALSKLFHEFAHAYVAKDYGLHVPQMGVAFLMFFPCLYCNTTEAWQLADRRQRMAIGAAGILAEGVLAIVSVYVWYFTKPGMLNSLAFYLIVVSFVSTVIFNGNPLLKYDGYFILMDFLRIPNLGTKSSGHVKYLFLNKVLGIASVTDTARDLREMITFTAYGISAAVYRVFLCVAIVTGVYYRFDKLLGIVLGGIAFVLFLVRPVVRGIKGLHMKKSEIRLRPLGLAVFAALLVAVAVPMAIPISSRTVYPCYLASARTQKLTVPLQTFVSDVFIRDGWEVRQGDVLFRLDTSWLEVSLRKKEIEKEIIRKEIELWLLDPKQMPEAGKKETELLKVAGDIEHIQKQLKQSLEDNVAPFDGVVTKLDERMQVGFQPGEGVVVGELQSTRDCVIQALVPGMDVDFMTKGSPVEIWFPVNGGVTLNKTITNIRTFSEKDLKDSPFSSRFGGEVATEIKSEAQKDAPLEDYYMCSSSFDNTQGIPLGITGRYLVPSAPKSLFSRFLDNLFNSFNRESVL